jgi:glycosyltransferase involved in cell wall biosynthesis
LRAVLLNQYYPPDTSATARLARSLTLALHARGADVTVIAGRPSYDPSRHVPWSPVHVDPEDGCRVVRVGSTTFDRSSMRGRVSNYVSFLGMAAPVAAAVRADVCVAMTDPPVVGAIAAAIRSLRNRPFVYWVQDLHPDMALAAGLLRPGRLADAWRAVHRRALAAADRVVVLGEDMAERAVASGARPDRVEVVHNGAVLGPEPEASDREHAIAREVRGTFEFVALHAGNLGFAGPWNTLLEAGRMLEPGSGIVFLGVGASETSIASSASTTAGVALRPRRPASESRWFNAAADLEIVALRRGLEGFVVPSKLYDALAAGRPILAVADERSEVVRIVRRHSCGLVADPDDAASVAAAIKWARAHPEQLDEMGRRGRAASRRYDRELMFDELARIVHEVGDRGRGR